MSNLLLPNQQQQYPQVEIQLGTNGTMVAIRMVNKVGPTLITITETLMRHDEAHEFANAIEKTAAQAATLGQTAMRIVGNDKP